MADVILVALIITFTLVCLAYIAWCDHIIGDAPVVEPVVEPLGTEPSADLAEAVQS